MECAVPRPTFQHFIAYPYVHQSVDREDQPGAFIGIPFDHGLKMRLILGMLQDGNILIVHDVFDLDTSKVIAEADTLLGIVVNIERYLKQRKMGATP
jgi:hypothetical protein